MLGCSATGIQSIEKPGVLLNFLQCTGKPHTTNNCPDQNVRVLRLLCLTGKKEDVWNEKGDNTTGLRILRG